MTQDNLDDLVRIGKEVPVRIFSIHLNCVEYKALASCTGRLHHCNPYRYFRPIFGIRFKGFVIHKIDGQYFSPKHIKPEPLERWWN